LVDKDGNNIEETKKKGKTKDPLAHIPSYLNITQEQVNEFTTMWNQDFNEGEF